MKLINKIKEKDIDVLLLIILICVVPVFIVPLWLSDELWNFAFIYKMNLGYIPYKELNIIVPPIFHIIGLIFLKILGANFLSFRIYNLIIISTILFLIFKIFKTLKMNKKESIINTLFIFIPFSTMFAAGANYNTLAYIPILTSLLLLFKDKKNYLIHGFLIFITLFIKQNIGVYFGIGIVIYILIQKKDIFKNLFKVFIINFIGTILTVILLHKAGILYDFCFYIIGGLKDFSTNNIYISYTIMMIIIIVVMNSIIMYFLKRNNIKEKEEIYKNIRIIYCIGIPLILVVYPIFNTFHIYMAMFVLWIGFMYVITNILIKEILDEKIITKLIIFLLVIILIKNFIVLATRVKEYDFIENEKSVYYGTLISKELENNINKMCKFIETAQNQGTKTIVLSSRANFYMLPLKMNNKYGMDLPFKGNLGSEGEKGLIKRIADLKECYVLIVDNEENMCWQESKEVREYIQTNLDKIGVIEDMYIYYKK